jgi:hypothetical protein
MIHAIAFEEQASPIVARLARHPELNRRAANGLILVALGIAKCATSNFKLTHLRFVICNL